MVPAIVCIRVSDFSLYLHSVKHESHFFYRSDVIIRDTNQHSSNTPLPRPERPGFRARALWDLRDSHAEIGQYWAAAGSTCPAAVAVGILAAVQTTAAVVGSSHLVVVGWDRWEMDRWAEDW